jgi:hypothetical protein
MMKATEDPGMLKGGSLSWMLPGPAKPVSLVWGMVGFMLATLAIVVLLWSLELVKSDPKELVFTCNPGSAYTTAECP